MRGRKWLPKNIIATISSIRRLLFYENRILWLKESIRKMKHTEIQNFCLILLMLFIITSERERKTN